MLPVVVDASVGIKWVLPEDHSEEATELLRGNFQLWVPDLFFAEVGNILWKRVRARLMDEPEARTVLVKLAAFPLRTFPLKALLLPAFEIATQTDRTVYDSVYLALALREETVLVTADRKLYNSLSATPLAPHLCWVEQAPALQ